MLEIAIPHLPVLALTARGAGWRTPRCLEALDPLRGDRRFGPSHVPTCAAV